MITAARALPETSDGADFIVADLTTPDGCAVLAEAAVKRFGGIDVLVHVVGGSSSPAGDASARRP